MNQLNGEATLSYIIDNNKSIIRFGDGEFGLLSGAGIFPPDSDWSQKYSKILESEIKRQLQLNNKNILLAFPPKSHLVYKEGEHPALNVISSMHTEARLYLNNYIKKNVIYGDCLVFVPHHNKLLDWKKIGRFIENKTVVVVTGGVSRLKDIKLGEQTFFVECGKDDAFERRQQIIEEIQKLITVQRLSCEKTLFWISLGCTAGFIVEHLSDQGYIAWDTGHIFRFAETEIKKELV